MRIAVIGCVKTKRNGRHKAKNLYASALFSLSYRYAVAHFDKVLILSARYGIISPERSIESYDSTVNGMPLAARKAWSLKAATQLRKMTSMADEIHFFCGRKYVEFVATALGKRSVHVHLEGLGLGERMRWFKDRIKTA